jgi:hypothetical protein
MKGSKNWWPRRIFQEPEAEIRIVCKKEVSQEWTHLNNIFF